MMEAWFSMANLRIYHNRNITHQINLYKKVNSFVYFFCVEPTIARAKISAFSGGGDEYLLYS